MAWCSRGCGRRSSPAGTAGDNEGVTVRGTPRRQVLQETRVSESEAHQEGRYRERGHQSQRHTKKEGGAGCVGGGSGCRVLGGGGGESWVPRKQRWCERSAGAEVSGEQAWQVRLVPRLVEIAGVADMEPACCIPNRFCRL